ncbi:MAG: polysaccharide pyruvyl transferase family protein [Phycisphaeraceae bacterium]
MKALLAGWYSFELMGATAGDLISRDLVADWLRRAGVAFDVALAPPFAGGVDWASVDPAVYDCVVFVCGPFGNGAPVDRMLERFAHCRWYGLNLSMLDRLEAFNPFELLWERDSDRAARPDLVFLSPPVTEPLVGVVLVHPQGEYKAKARHEQANDAAERLIARQRCPVVRIDTRLDENSTGQRSADEIELLIARTDLVVTTRLHGTVLALKNGVPVIAIDPIAGGAKIIRQTRTIGWPHRFDPESLDDAALDNAFAACLKPEARTLAQQCARQARSLLAPVQDEVITALTQARQRTGSRG